MRKLPPATVREKVAAALHLVRLGDLGGRLPRQLSGGQQQRVALARALVIEPDALLLDEPLSNLDAKLREEVRVEIRQLQKALGLTTLMVTHDQDEAMADRLVVMAGGVIQQIGTQRDLYERPANRFVAGFVGRTNFLAGRLVGAGLFETDGGLAIRCGSTPSAGLGMPSGGQSAPAEARRTLALRPERLTLAPCPDAVRGNDVAGKVEFASYLGAVIEYHVRLGSGEMLRAHVPNTGAAGDRPYAPGEPVHVSWPVEVGLVLEDDHHHEEVQR